VHYVVGYENLWHLTPAFAGLAVFIIAQALCYPYLAASDAALLDEWRERRRSVRADDFNEVRHQRSTRPR
jgi:hypothetical protein